MIIDKIENANLYTGLSERLVKALEILKDPNIANQPDGRHDVDGDKLYYMVQNYETMPPDKAKLEAHRKYIDVQFLAKGEEALLYAPLENLGTDTAYVEADDYALYLVPQLVSSLTLKPGMFCILYPNDTHAPCCRLNGTANVTKVVVKVRID